MLFAAVLMVNLITALCQDVSVTTNYGRIRGQVKEFDGKPFTEFLGIPYAAAPVGELRFKPPRRHAGWGDTTLDALNPPAACPQYPGYSSVDPTMPPRLLESDQEDEDCLFLNIYISGDLTSDLNRALPVIVFIHGGGFTVGSVSFEIGDVFVTDAEPLVMVAIQYRLGVLGFLSSGDDALPGNLGLKDQNFALQWVQENIANFGGNPQQVTICGLSAGGESILAHMISPMSSGLFHKASAQSSPSAWSYRTQEASNKYFRRYGEDLDCRGNSETVLECLRMKTWQEIIAFQEEYYDALYERVIDGEFITDDPEKLWAQGLFNDADLMLGFSSDDGALVMDFVYPEFAADRSRDLELFYAAVGLTMFSLLSDELSPDNGVIVQNGNPVINYNELMTVIKGRYYDSATEQLQKARGILDCLRDTVFGSFNLFVASQVAQKNGKVYFYIFDHRTALLGSSSDNEVELKAPHAGELAYQFGYGLTDPDDVVMTADEITLTHSVIQAWTSFVSGNTSYLTMQGEKIEWTQYTTDRQNILVFDTEMSEDSFEDGEEVWEPVLDFWLAIRALAQFEDDDNEKWTVYPPPSLAPGTMPSVVLLVFTTAFTVY